LLQANDVCAGNARVRITVTGGPGPLGSERGESTETTMIAATPTPAMGEAADVVVVPYTRNENGALAGVKSTSYGENVVALAYAKQRGGGEAIFANTKGELCEGTGSNLFLGAGGTVLTPPLEAGCLAGVTRALVLELCAREGIAVSERAMPITALHGATEAFLTSTTREVQPIRKVDGMALRDVPGKTTARLRAAFRALADATIDP
jgi:branched-chain amino acid aminotransferase